jgi:GNAT superfamily N-acetyltransferase
LPEVQAKLTFKPVTKARWPDFVSLFEAPGGPHYCWCMAWRATPDEIRDVGKASRKPLMQSRVDGGTTIGLLGYLDGEPAAWVSIAPRDTYRDLGGPEAKEGEVIWSLACMYVRRQLRGEGHGRELIEAAAKYARKRGATVLEAYPVDPKSPSYRFMGFVPAFERLGFESIGKAGSRRNVMRLKL